MRRLKCLLNTAVKAMNVAAKEWGAWQLLHGLALSACGANSG
jgi:hypothetical protein